MLTRDDLLGSWDRVSYERRVEGGGTTFPLGEKARGRLFYAAEGTP
jgi:hypothetical protein